MAGKETLLISNESTFSLSPERKIEEKCGIVGIRTQTSTRHFGRLLDAGIGVQHRGQLGAGVRLYLEDKASLIYVNDGLLSSVFTEDVVRKLDLNNIETKLSLLHCRYGTNGGYESFNLQPCIATTAKGEEIAVIHNGQFTGIDKMKKDLKEEGVILDNSASDTRLFTELLAKAEGNSWDEKILSTLDRVDGAYNLIIQVGDVMYVARDRQGVHPLCLGEISFSDTKGFIAVSESSGLDDTGANYLRPIYAGEVFKVDDDGLTQLREGEEEDKAFCSFEMAYFARMDSLRSSGETFAAFRERCGRIMATRLKGKLDIDFLLEVPDSAIDFSAGFTEESGIPLKRYIRKTHFRPDSNGRLFQGDRSIESIGNKVLNKLKFVPGSHWDGAKVAVLDDSIVRGSESRIITEKLRELGVKEVHWIIGYPPVKHTCHLGISMRSREELIANKGDKTATLINATSVNHITLIDYIQAASPDRQLTIPKNPLDLGLSNGLCFGCINGRHPIGEQGETWLSE